MSGDSLVSIIEKFHMVGGYCMDCEVGSIDYVVDESGMVFQSVVNTTYLNRQIFDIDYTYV